MRRKLLIVIAERFGEMDDRIAGLKATIDQVLRDLDH